MSGVSLSPLYRRIQHTIERLESGARTPQISAAIKNLKAAGKDVRNSCPRTMLIPVTPKHARNGRSRNGQSH